MDFSTLSRRQLAVSFLVIGLAVGASAAYLALNFDKVSGDEAGEKLVSTLERQTGQELELIRTESENSLYRADVLTEGERLITFYISRDGSMMAAETAMTDIDRSIQVLDAREDFSQCLEENSVVMYGDITEQETQFQVQLIGGAEYIEPIYRDVNDEEILQEATDRGIERLPAFYYQGSRLQGISQVEDIEELTGCELGLEE